MATALVAAERQPRLVRPAMPSTMAKRRGCRPDLQPSSTSRRHWSSEMVPRVRESIFGTDRYWALSGALLERSKRSPQYRDNARNRQRMACEEVGKVSLAGAAYFNLVWGDLVCENTLAVAASTQRLLSTEPEK
jgi:hypothetical protein